MNTNNKNKLGYKREKNPITLKTILIVVLSFFVMSCESLQTDNELMKPVGHLSEKVPVEKPKKQKIPPIVKQLPIVTPPKPIEKEQTFTVVVAEVPANELLFALSRDARLNLDIDPNVNGLVSINAIDQTLPQILNRISRQVDLRYYVDGPNLVVEVDKPYSKIYRIDYLNMARATNSTISLSSEIASTGTSSNAAGNNSSTSISNTSDNKFWETLETNITSIISGLPEANLISNRETGVLSVFARDRDHKQVQSFIDQVMSSARQQVLIEATVVEVTLNDDFKAGVDWSKVASGNGWSFSQGLAVAGDLSTTSALFGTFTDVDSDNSVRASITALDEFGDVTVMSSPKIMALNNQTSILKVVSNTVYFTSSSEAETNGTTGTVTNTITTSLNTVPVGFVMNVTPFITENNEVILNVRPTISRIIRFVNDPNPAFANAGVTNSIPEIQVREMESVLRVADGNTAVIGGLMQDSNSQTRTGLPGLSESENFGLLFGQQAREQDKTELVIFLRPRIIKSANINGELQDFQRFLKPKAFNE